jgi:hypothetical protein
LKAAGDAIYMVDNEEKFAGMTREEVLKTARELNQEFDENDEDSKTYSEYIKMMEAGQEALKTQKGYYRQEGGLDN